MNYLYLPPTHSINIRYGAGGLYFLSCLRDVVFFGGGEGGGGIQLQELVKHNKKKL